MASPVIVGEGRTLASVEQSVAVIRPQLRVKVGLGHLEFKQVKLKLLTQSRSKTQ